MFEIIRGENLALKRAVMKARREIDEPVPRALAALAALAA